MTRDLLIIIFSIIALILIIYFLIRIYASWKIGRLYEELKKYEVKHLYNKCNDTVYLNKYLDVVFFRNSYYLFLSDYCKNTLLKNRHFYIQYALPNISEDIDKEYLSDLF